MNRMKNELETVDIVDALTDMSQWLWVTEQDLRRNLLANLAKKEILRLRVELKKEIMEIIVDGQPLKDLLDGFFNTIEGLRMKLSGELGLDYLEATDLDILDAIKKLKGDL